MSNELSLDHSKWIATIDNAKEKCLTSIVSAKNVKHVLSTATIRSPQKNLLTAILPFIPEMLSSVPGTSILTSLVRYGTVKTVDAVAEEAAEVYNKHLLFIKPVEYKLMASLGELLDALVYRADCKGDHRNKILMNLKSCDSEHLFGSSLTLVAAGRFFCIDCEFRDFVLGDDKAKLAICRAAKAKETKLAALRCCELIIHKEPDNGTNHENLSVVGSVFLFSVFKESLSSSATKPREEFLEILTRYSPPDIVSEIGKLVKQWPDIYELSKKDSYAVIISNVLEHGANEKSSIKLLGVIFKNIEDIDNRLNSPKTVNWRLLAAIARLPSAVSFLEKKMSTSIYPKLHAAKVRYESATIPKAEGTRKNILEKLKQLRSKDVVKRPRE